MGNVLIIRGFDNPFLTVMWLRLFHINASSGQQAKMKTF